MAYGLPRRNTVKTLLGGGCFNAGTLGSCTAYKDLVQEPSGHPVAFLGRNYFGSPIKLTKSNTFKNGLLPTAEIIKIERKHEMKRLENLKCQKKRS